MPSVTEMSLWPIWSRAVMTSTPAKVYQSAEGMAELVRGEGVDAHGQAARAIFVLWPS